MIFDEKKIPVVELIFSQNIANRVEKKKRLWIRTFQINNRFAVTSTALYLFGWFGFLVFVFFVATITYYFCGSFFFFLHVSVMTCFIIILKKYLKVVKSQTERNTFNIISI